MKRLSLLLLMALCTLLAMLASADTASTAERKNVVLFVTDDLGCDTGCYGNPTIRTPEIDRLAREGVLFTNAFCTTASCSSSRSVILTGLYNHANGQYGLAHAEHHFAGYHKLLSLPMMLSQAGYRTALIGKLHVQPESAYKFEKVLRANSRNTVQMAEACREFISEESERPFFLYFCPTDPHRSGDTVDVGGVPANAFGNIPGGHPGVKEQEYDPRDVVVQPFLPDTTVSRAELTQYYTSVSRIDQGLGRLREILKEAGAEKDTLIIFTSDNGIAFQGAKTTLYDPGMRIPLLVYSPEIKNAAHRCEAFVTHADLTPTILEYAGVKPEGKMHGRSWLSVLTEEKPAGWNEVYASHTFHEVTMYYPMRVVLDRQYKLIWNLAHPLEYPSASDLYDSPTWQEALQRGRDSSYGKRTVEEFLNRPQFELYDLAADPDEVKNLADSEEHRQVAERLKQKLRDFQKATDDPWILKWKRE
jgi:N-sulfoglucosamine sulfohydrolase